MTPDRWKKVNEIFQSAAELEDDERGRYLDEKCIDDDELRNQVEELLQADSDAGTFLGGNAASDVEHLINPNIDKTLTGESFNNYEVISLLGKGGMGRVYLAEDSKLNRKVALKTIPTSFSKHTEHLKRFETEARAAATINHPNVATIYSVEETEDDRVFITMEYVEGSPLDSHFQDDGIDLRTFLSWFVPLSDALSHAHDKGVIHRDIKPSNIMLTPLGTPKILDFGLARIDRSLVSDDESTLSLTKTGQVMGTPAYMSPEQAEGKPLDHRTDIFSLGVIMYEAITGSRPFKGDNYASIVSALLTHTPSSVQTIRPDVPELIARVIMKCLEKNPMHRYGSMEEVRVLLGEINSAIGSGASISLPKRTANTSASGISRFFLPAVAIAGLLGTLGFGALYLTGSVEETQNSLTIFIDEGIDPNLTDARLSPDGSYVIYKDRVKGQGMLLRRSLNKFTSSPIRGSESARDPFFSRDGQWIGFHKEQKGLWKVSSGGGDSVPLCEECRPVNGASWGSSGKIVYPENDGLYSISDQGGNRTRVTKLGKGERSHYEPHFLPNGSDFIFTVRKDGTPMTAVYDASEKNYRILEDAGIGIYPIFFENKILFSRQRIVFAIEFDPNTLTTSGEPVQILENAYRFYPKLHVASNKNLVYLPAVRHYDSSLVWVDSTGKETKALPDQNEYTNPRLSPDRQQVAVIIGRDLWIRDLGKTTGSRLTSEGSASYPLWSPDGRTIYYTIQKSDNWTIYSRPSDGSGSPRELFVSDRMIRPGHLNPEGDTIVSSYFPSRGKGDIIAIDVATGKKETIVKGASTVDMPRFSPDGRWLAYFSIESGKNQIFVIPWKREGKRVLINEKGGLFPVWSNDNKFIFTRSPTRTYRTPISVSGDTITVSPKERILEQNYRTVFDIDDDNRLLNVKTQKGLFPKHLNVITRFDKVLDQAFNSNK